MARKIKVFIVDDSALVRKILSTQLPKCEDLEVIGTAADPYEAREKIVENKPDVLLLDIEMPKMDGLTFLTKLMDHYPLPIIIVSSLSKAGSDVAVRAMELGAADVMAKPGGSYSVGDMIDELIFKIKAASTISVSSLKNKVNLLKTIAKPETGNPIFKTTDKVIAIGSSTGGTEAVKGIIAALPTQMPPILIAQHMPENFTASWASRMNELSKLKVVEAKQGEEATAGKVLVAPGGYHMTLQRNGARYYIELNKNERVHHQRPSCDVLFDSVAKTAGRNAIGVILTGMGRDGASGLKTMKEAGAYTLAQDEKSCIVFGMPKVAIEEGAAMEVISLDKVANRLVQLL